MNDMRPVITPKSDQLNADDLLCGPMTITITEVKIKPGEQPVSIHYEGDAGKPYKPCKSMARVMVHCWGADANAYVGRRLTIYRDGKVTWAGMEVGGIRISNMSHIKGQQQMALTVTKGSKKPFVVLPLPERQAQPGQATQQPKKAPLTWPEWLDRFEAALKAAPDNAAVIALLARHDAREAADKLDGELLDRFRSMTQAASARFVPPPYEPGQDDDEELEQIMTGMGASNVMGG